MKKILFVCLGNICRSPMAEGIFKHKTSSLELSHQLISDSAGTGAYHIGQQPDPRTIETLNNHDIRFRHAARKVTSEDADHFDYVLAMDQQNYLDLKAILPEGYKGLYMMRDFDPMAKGADVPDPYFGGQDGFENVYQMLNRSLDEFIVFLKSDNE